jgi:hypothetical protein
MKYSSVALRLEDVEKLHYIKYRTGKSSIETIGELLKKEEERLRKEEK